MNKNLVFFKIFLQYIVVFIVLTKSIFAFDNFTKEEMEYLKHKKSIKVYLVKDWAPFRKCEFTQAYGYLKGYFKLIGNKIGKKIVCVESSKLNADEDILQDKSIDMIATLRATKQRKKIYDFGNNALFYIYYSVVSSKGKRLRMDELENKRVAIVKGSFAIETIRKYYPKIKLVECDTNLEMLKSVLRKRVDAAFGNYFVLSYLIEKNFMSGLSNFPIEDNSIIKKVPQYIAYGKDDKILKSIIEKTIKNIDKEEIFLLKEKWLNLPIKRRVYLTNEEKSFLKHHIVSISLTTTWLPINSENKEGNIVGIGVDYWKLIAKKAHIRYRFEKAKNFTEVLRCIKEKKCDINIATSKTLDKEQYAIFSKSYEKFPIAIATKRRDRFIINGVELEGKRVAVGKSYSTYFLLKSVYPKINFVFADNVKQALEMVEKDKAFAAVDIEPVLHHQIIDNNFNDIVISGVTGVDFNLQIMARDDYHTLISIINKAISIITNEERINIYKKWMGLHKRDSVDYKLLWEVTIVFLIIIFIIIIAYIKQRKLHNKIKQLNHTLEERIKIAVEKNKRDQLVILQQSRLAQMGEIISMIAHQWRQPLNSLMWLNATFVSKCRSNAVSKSDIDIYEMRSKKLIKQMSNTIDDFRNFFKPEKKRVCFSVNSSIQKSVDIVKSILKHHKIELIMDIRYDPMVCGYPNEFSQAIINILNNSKDALLECKFSSYKEIKIELLKKDDKIHLSFYDNGCGIKEEILDRIFDSYFSTKENKNGTGLGLYITKTIVEKHMNGTIRASNWEYGAKIEIILKEIDDKTICD